MDRNTAAATLQGRRIVLGISGGIAAYKTPELVRRLCERGASVQVALTHSARAFVTDTTLKAVGATLVSETASDQGMTHIDAARWADVILIAPATAHLIARLAIGAADDILTTLCLASEAPLLLAPAMNRVMWGKAVTRNNCRLLEERGTLFLGPEPGAQACGEIGMGRMMEPEGIVEALENLWGGRLLQGIRAIVTAGPTYEPVDPVRGLTNRSSGKMGYAIAAALAQQGADVVLVSGPTGQPTPPNVRRIDVMTAEDMLAAVHGAREDVTLFVGAAAVADYRPEQAFSHKLKKESASRTLTLVRNPDILAEVAKWQPPPYTVGFALETEDLERHARDKLKKKGLDLIIGNMVGPDTGIDSDRNALTLIDRETAVTWPADTKITLATRLAKEIAHRLKETHYGPTN